MAIKPKRKSRIISDEFEKTRADKNQREEITNLLNKSELTEQKIIGIINEHIVYIKKFITFFIH